MIVKHFNWFSWLWDWQHISRSSEWSLSCSIYLPYKTLLHNSQKHPSYIYQRMNMWEYERKKNL